ncbi:MAG: response regulator, partial [Treponema sp.]|nr:response regulator [Treponema sp.]
MRKPFLQQALYKRSLPASILIVLMAFSIMLVLSCLVMFNTLNRKLLDNVNQMMNDKTHFISHLLVEPEATLNFITTNMENMYNRGEGIEAIKAYMVETSSDEFKERTKVLSYFSVFGYFHDMGGFFDGGGWQPTPGYNPYERLWFIAATAGGGNLAITSPYIDLDSQMPVIAYARQLFDNAGNLIGIVGIDVKIDYIRDIVVGSRVTPGSYGFMVDKNMTVIIHPNLDIQGEFFGKTNNDIIRFSDAISKGLSISLESVRAYTGTQAFVFGRQTENDWYFCIIVPEQEYYNDLYRTIFIISGLGAFLAIVLVTILVLLNVLKNRADKVHQEKSIRLAALEALRESDERTKLMLESSPLSCLLWDKNLNIIDCNEVAVKLFEFEDKQELMDKFIESSSPELLPDGRRTDEMIYYDVKKTFEEGFNSFNWMHRKPDGTPIPAKVTLVRVKYGNDCVVAGYAQDLRELDITMAELHKSKDLLERQLELTQIVNDTAAALLATNTVDHTDVVLKNMEIFCRKLDGGRVYLWQNNRKDDGDLYFRATLGWAAEGVRTMDTTNEFPYKDILPSWPEIFSRYGCINGPINKFSEKEYESLSKHEMQSLLCVPIFIREEFWGFVGIDDPFKCRTFSTNEEEALRSWSLIVVSSILRNNTANELKDAVMDAEIANRTKSSFLATMSHEIRTPMNSIMGFAELALDSESIVQINEYLGKIADSTKWLLRIINDILDISKIESGKMEFENVPFDLHDIFSRCQSVILPSIKEKGLELSVYMEPSTGKKMLGDPLRLYQVLMNLLSNAVKFTNTGVVKFSSTIKSSDDNSTVVYFEVKDTGIGMSPEQIEKIFDPFIQADSSTTRDYGGTGLGLAIAKNLVELMGGELTVESEKGVGSAFSFGITFKTIEASNDVSDPQKFTMLEKPYFDGLVLICDDNSLNQQVICAHLERVGLQTMTAKNGKIGVEMVSERKESNQKPFDLILMDMFMPVMDGIEAASLILAMDTGTPVVAMTANVMISEVEKYKKHGMPDCLAKPFTSQELWEILLKYLTPVSSELIDAHIDEYDDDKEQQRMIQLYFYRNNQTMHNEIAEAFTAGNTKLAHRLAHTLKGNAGLLGKTGLKNAASNVEALLRDGVTSIWETRMNILK